MSKAISLEFDGFWIEQSIAKLPKESGIFAVFEGTYDRDTNKVSLGKLIFIGESDNAHDSVNNEEELSKWKTFRGDPEEEDDGFSEKGELFFSFAPANSPDRERAAAKRKRGATRSRRLY